MALQDIWEKYPVYDDLVPTTRTKKEFKKLYKELQNKFIESGKFPNKQARGLNKAVLQEIGEFPYWPKGKKDPVPLGEGEVHKMSAGEPRPISVRDPTNSASNNKRFQILKEADELMTAAGFGEEVKVGKRNFKNQDRSGGMALDHEYETQEFGADYERLKKNFAAGVISEKEFKKELNTIIERKPGNINSNLKLKTEKENYAKMDKTRRIIKDKNLAENYKVRDASYTKKMAAFTKNLNKVNVLSGVHAYAKQVLAAQTQGYDATLVTNGKTNGHTNGNTNGKTNGFKNGGKKINLNGNKTNNYRGLSALLEQPNTWSDPILMAPPIRTLDKSIDIRL
tara:strand:- start:29 stop:1045 length:1017 start_codon:yes stop_codon:yes gene_type:complete